MADDIFVHVREEILKEDAKSLPWVPKHLDKTWEMQAGIAGAIAGAWAGAAFGAHLGIVGGWGGIVGTVPCAIVGGVIGYFSGAKVGATIQRDKPQNLLVDQRGPMTIAASEYSRKIQSEDNCLFCNAPKSSWWDNDRNKCGKCGKGRTEELRRKYRLDEG